MIKVSHLRKQFMDAEYPAVDDLSFSFQRGRIVGLLGPNGAGKTTTISILCGLMNDFDGQVDIMGLPIRKNADIIQRKMAVVPQQIALYPDLSCRENLWYFGQLYQIPNKLLHEKIDQLLERFGLHEHAKKQIKKYSGGMKRRANLIASLHNDPELLILDEPTAGVDVHSRNMILQFLREYNALGNSILYTSHLLDEAEALCHEVLIIDHGKKIVHGEPANLITAHGATDLETLFLKLTGNKVRD